MPRLILCLDSGTTSVKAASFDAAGKLVSMAERPNSALRRSGDRVEQDMDQSRDDAFAVLSQCMAASPDEPVGLIVTAQGDGTWPLDAELRPAGVAMTWLDGRARGLVADLGAKGTLDAIERITFSRPTAASQSLQLLWLSQHEPERFDRIRHALRLKEWLFLSLTGTLRAEPSALLPTWGDWRSGQVSDAVEQALGLSKGASLLPQLLPIGACHAELSPEAAQLTGLPAGIPVLIGPGDVQSSLIGLGLGVNPEVERASIFGTSAIHGCHLADPATMTRRPAGAMVQAFALGFGYVGFHPSFNGAPLVDHLRRLTGRAPQPGPVEPAYSGLILHPFLEPGGERAPITSAQARGAMIGLTAATTAAQIDWAGREALAFMAKMSHDMMSGSGALALGGGLSGDRAFVRFLATVMQIPVLVSRDGQAGLRGAGAIAAFHLLGVPKEQLAAQWLSCDVERVAPETGAVAEYAAHKYALFSALLDAVSPHWPHLCEIEALTTRIATT